MHNGRAVLYSLAILRRGVPPKGRALAIRRKGKVEMERERERAGVPSITPIFWLVFGRFLISKMNKFILWRCSFHPEKEKHPEKNEENKRRKWHRPNP